MYRIATDEWISSGDVSAYQPVSIVYTTPAVTRLYDNSGNTLNRTLPAGTTWKVDRIITVNGHDYCRVANNEYIQKD